MDSRNQAAAAATVQVGMAVRIALGLGAAALAMGSPVVFAAAADANANGNGLEEVVVTAQFRQQSLQTTPLAITAISGDMLAARSENNITQIANEAPSVSLKPQGSAYGDSLGASIRGIGQYDFNPALEPGVGIYVDDVYYPTLTGSILDLLDLDRVEILRGPQGTLAGKNSIGGSVKLYSKQPTGSGTGYVGVTYGSNSRVDLRGSADFALSDTMFIRLAGVSRHQGGYVSRLDYGCSHPGSGFPVLSPANGNCVVGTEGDINYNAVRAALRWTPSDNLEISGSFDYTNDDHQPAGEVMVQGSTAIKQNIQPAGVLAANALPLSAFKPPVGSYYNYATFFNPGATLTLANGSQVAALQTSPPIHVSLKGWGAAGNIDYKISDKLTLKSISSYREYTSFFANDNDLSPLANSLGFGTLDFHSFSEELRLNGALLDRDALEYTVGGFYLKDTSVYATDQDLRYSATSYTEFIGHDPVNSETKAAFLHLAYKATDKLTLNGGLRYTSDHKDYTFSRRAYNGGPPQASLANLDGYTNNYDHSNMDYRANVQYQWTDSVMTYLQYATGIKGGGVSPRPFDYRQAIPFNPEKLGSYEFGVKSDFFDRKLRINSDIYYSKYTDLQVGLSNCGFLTPNNPALPCGALFNAGNADIRGFELESVIKPLAGLQFDVSYSYLKFKYTYLDPKVSGITSSMVPAYTPKVKISTGVQYEFLLGDVGSLTPRLDSTYISQQYSSGVNALTNRIAPYELMNARLTWRDGKGNWEAAAEVTNLTDRYYFLTRFDQFTSTGVTSGQPGRPREFALTVKKKF